jgi:hypothetical protein
MVIERLFIGFPFSESKALTERQFAVWAEQLKAVAKTQTIENAKTQATGPNTIKSREADVRFSI